MTEVEQEVRILNETVQIQQRRIADLERHVMEILQRLQKVDAVSRIRVAVPGEKIAAPILGKTLGQM